MTLSFQGKKTRLIQLNEESEFTFQMPSLDDLEMSVGEAKNAAMLLSKQCGMILESYDDVEIARDTTTLIEHATTYEDESEDSENTFSHQVDDIDRNHLYQGRSVCTRISKAK